MTAIWKDDGASWNLLLPTGFPDEATLHQLVAEAPHILPLSGIPQLAIIGAEVALAGNRADLIAIEPSGRLAIIEIKLAQNAEARRAVIAQVLTYAAHLRGETPESVAEILNDHLSRRGFRSLLDAALSIDQIDEIDTDEFERGLAHSLRSGGFRLVLVLDQAPPELVKLVGFLEAVTSELVIDLITVASYQIDESRIIVPRRVDPERELGTVAVAPRGPAQTPSKGMFYRGPDEFLASIEDAEENDRPSLRRLANWALELEKIGVATLGAYRGKTGRVTLLPYIPGEDAGLVTIWNDRGAYLSFWRSVFERRAPIALKTIESMPTGLKIGQGNTARDISDELLDLLSDAYREAATGRVSSKVPTDDVPDDG